MRPCQKSKTLVLLTNIQYGVSNICINLKLFDLFFSFHRMFQHKIFPRIIIFLPSILIDLLTWLGGLSQNQEHFNKPSSIFFFSLQFSLQLLRLDLSVSGWQLIGDREAEMKLNVI